MIWSVVVQKSLSCISKLWFVVKTSKITSHKFWKRICIVHRYFLIWFWFTLRNIWWTDKNFRYKKYYYSMSEGHMRLCSPLCCCCPCWAPLSPSLCLASFHSSLARRPSHFVSLSRIHPWNFLLWCAKWCPPLFSLKHKIDHFYQITYPVKKVAHCCNFPLEVDVHK